MINGLPFSVQNAEHVTEKEKEKKRLCKKVASRAGVGGRGQGGGRGLAVICKGQQNI